MPVLHRLDGGRRAPGIVGRRSFEHKLLARRRRRNGSRLIDGHFTAYEQGQFFHRRAVGSQRLDFLEDFFVQRRHARFRMLQQHFDGFPVVPDGRLELAFLFIEFALQFQEGNGIGFDGEKFGNERFGLPVVLSAQRRPRQESIFS